MLHNMLLLPLQEQAFLGFSVWYKVQLYQLGNVHFALILKYEITICSLGDYSQWWLYTFRLGISWGLNRGNSP